MDRPGEVPAGILQRQRCEPSLKRVLSMGHLVWFGLSYLAPIGVFTQVGLLAGMTHGMLTLSYLVSTAVIMFTACSYAKMVSIYPVSGSVYSYVRRAINPYIGFITGWTMLLDYILLPMVCFLYLGLYLNNYCPVIPVWAWIVICVVIVGIINILGIEPTVTVNRWTVILQAGFALWFVVVVARLIMKGGGAGTFFYGKALYNPMEFQMDSFLASVGILTIAFLGFDAVTTLAEEVVQPEKTVGRALIFVCLLAGGFFALESYFCQIAWPSAWREIVNPETGFLEVALKLRADYMQPLYLWISNLASLTCAISAQTAISRILFGMGRDGVLPKSFFGRINPRFKTPVNNILMVSAISLTAIAFSNHLIILISLISFGALCGFAMVNTAVIFHFFRQKRQRPLYEILHGLVSPLAGACLCFYFLLNLASQTKRLGFAWVAAGVVYTAVTTGFFKKIPPDLSLDTTG